VVTFLRGCVEWDAVFFEVELVDLCVVVDDFFLGVVVLSCARAPLLDQVSRQANKTVKRLK
jgi:hypothetical protein